jgi:hypothetical protein
MDHSRSVKARQDRSAGTAIELEGNHQDFWDSVPMLTTYKILCDVRRVRARFRPRQAVDWLH